MAWQTEMVRLLRHLISDLDEDEPTYSDDRLQELLLVAAQLVQGTVTFSQTYITDVDEVLLSPDPTVRDQRDDAFINLTLLKAACVLDQADARRYAGQAIEIADYSSRISIRGIASAKLALLDKGWCKAFDEAKFEFESGNVGSAGAAILGPYRTAYSSYCQAEPYYNDGRR